MTVARVEEIATTSGIVHDQAQLHFQMLNGKYEEIVGMYHSGGPAAAPAPATGAAPSAPVDPTREGNEAWSNYLGKGSGGSTAPGGRPLMMAHTGTPPTLDPPRVNGRWAMSDEKYIMLPGLTSNKFDSKSPQTWLQSTRGNVAGHTIMNVFFHSNLWSPLQFNALLWRFHL